MTSFEIPAAQSFLSSSLLTSAQTAMGAPMRSATARVIFFIFDSFDPASLLPSTRTVAGLGSVFRTIGSPAPFAGPAPKSPPGPEQAPPLYLFDVPQAH